MRENHYAILAHLKISQVSNYKISITLLLNLKYHIGWSCLNPVTKVAKLSDNLHYIFIILCHGFSFLPVVAGLDIKQACHNKKKRKAEDSNCKIKGRGSLHILCKW